MRVIPIEPSAPASHETAASAAAGAGPLQRPLARRELLRGSGLLMGSLVAGSVLAGLAPSTAWALELTALSSAEGETLLRMGRDLYPQRRFPDAIYALLVKDLDAKAAADPASATTLREGLAQLDPARGGRYVRQSQSARLARLKAIEAGPFFALVRGQCITSLYDNEMAFALLGYPGSSWEKGGYLLRGFQDLKWLPAPPPEASPAPWLG